MRGDENFKDMGQLKGSACQLMRQVRLRECLPVLRISDR